MLTTASFASRPDSGLSTENPADAEDRPILTDALTPAVRELPRTTIEAAEALGYTRFSAYCHIVLPLAIRVCLPALNNNPVNLLKTTTLAYAIAVPETLYALKQIWSESQNVMEMMILLLATYGILVGVLVWLMHRWERAMHIPGYHR